MGESISFRHTILVAASDIDDMGHVNNVVYVRYIQEVAAAHWAQVASEELKEKYLWVVLHHEIDYRNPAFLSDEIIGETWVGEHQGARFERFVKLTSSSSGKILVESKTVWCMLDAETGRPVRIGDDVLGVL